MRIVLPDDLFMWYSNWVNNQKIKYYRKGFEKYPHFSSYVVIPKSDENKDEHKDCKKVYLDEYGWTHLKLKTRNDMFAHWGKRIRLAERAI